jgi:nitroreductase
MLPVMSLEVLVVERPLRNNISFAIQAFTNCSYAALFFYCATSPSFMESISVEYYKGYWLRKVYLMDFLELAKKRYSVRNYQPRKVEEDKLLKILEAGRVAPTGANRQPHRLIVVQEAAGMERLKKAANPYGAPLAIIVCADHNATWKRNYDGKDIADIDAAIVTDHMMLEATDMDLGTLWVCHFNPEVLKKEFNIPENLEPMNILCIGYRAGEAESPDRHNKLRLPLEDFVHYESYKY